MRDFRDAKIMAHALRDALKTKTVETTHSECLELIAKAFGYENWNVLSAKIEAAESHDAGRAAPSSTTMGEAVRTRQMKLQDLESKSPVELLGFAEEHSVENASTMRKQELMFAIIEQLAAKEIDTVGEGVVEVLQDGSGFLRSPEANYLPGPNDIYVSPSQIRRLGLRTGDTIEGEIRSPKEGERYFALLKVKTINFEDPGPQTTLYCSFCGKSQHEVRKLIAGPTIFICDECVSLCDDIIDREDEQGILNLLKGDADSGDEAYQAALEHVHRMSTEEVKSFVIRCSRAAERNGVALQSAQRALAIRDGEVPQEGEAFAWVKEAPRERLLTHIEEVERRLQRYDTALRIGVTVLDGRGQQS
jgi:hypothetical protein